MIKRYLLIGVVSVAGLLIVAAIITANTNTGDLQKTPTLSNSTANIATAVPEEKNNGASTAKPNTAKAVLDVQGMSCSGCIYQIKSGLADITGISDVLVDLNSGRVEVFYDSTQVKDLEKIASAITAVGYPATLKQTMTENEIEKENNLFAVAQNSILPPWETGKFQEVILTTSFHMPEAGMKKHTAKVCLPGTRVVL